MQAPRSPRARCLIYCLILWMWVSGVTPTSQRTNRDMTLRLTRWPDLCHEIMSISKDFKKHAFTRMHPADKQHVSPARTGK